MNAWEAMRLGLAGRPTSEWHDPTGWHVTMPYKGRTLLGTVRGVTVTEYNGTRSPRLIVRHFDGTPWPKEPSPVACEALEREYETGDE